MKKLLLSSLLALLLTACSTLDAAKKETTEAVQNIQTEAEKVTDKVTEKVDQVNQAVDSVNQAVSDVKAVTGTEQ